MHKITVGVYTYIHKQGSIYIYIYKMFSLSLNDKSCFLPAYSLKIYLMSTSALELIRQKKMQLVMTTHQQ